MKSAIQPTIGRIVLFKPIKSTEHLFGRFEDQNYPAIIVSVAKSLARVENEIIDAEERSIVDLKVFTNMDNDVLVRNICYSEEPKEGCWSWLPRV